MKPNYLLTSMLALATIVVTSCSAPRLAQQNDVNDDVYNTTAQAKEYVQPQPRVSDYNEEEDDGYGTSDPYSDMDYSSRINRFYNGSPFRSYYDPFYGGFYGYNNFSPWYSPGFSFGLGLGWGSPFYGGFGYSPFWGFNNYYGGAFGGGYYGGGYYGGGFYGGGYGGGFLTGRSNTPRPIRGRENGVGYRSNPNYGIQRPGTTRTVNGNVVNSGRRGDRGINSGNADRNRTNTSSRPTRTERYNPPARTQERPTYNPPSNYGGRSGGSMGGGGGGGGRSSRGGRN